MGLIISMAGALVFNATPVVWVFYCMNEILNHSADFLPTLLAGIAGGVVQMVVGGLFILLAILLIVKLKDGEYERALFYW